MAVIFVPARKDGDKPQKLPSLIFVMGFQRGRDPLRKQSSDLWSESLTQNNHIISAFYAYVHFYFLEKVEKIPGCIQ